MRSRNLRERKSRNGSDYYQTPDYATALLLPYVSNDWTIWEPAAGKGMMSNVLSAKANVISTDIDYCPPFDFLNDTPDFDFDCIITNPPFSKKDEFLAKCYHYKKPFALLMPLTALEGIKRGSLYARHGISLIIPNRRVNFIDFDGEDKGACWFPVAWFTWNIQDNDLVFEELNREKVHISQTS